MNPKKSVLLFIPAKNEELSIAHVIEACTAALSQNTDIESSILVIDDGSSDKTTELALSRGASVIRHEINEGLGATFQEAVEYSLKHGFDLLITIDADGQFSPEDLPKLYEPVLAGSAHVTTGSRFLDQSKVTDMPWIKRIGNHMMAALISSIVDRRFYDVSCGFRAYDREALLRLHLFGRFTYTQEVFLNLSHKRMKILEIPISVTYFSSRTSRIASSLLKYGYQTMKIIIKAIVYYRPLRFFGLFTVVLWSISIPISVALTIRYAISDTITPFKGIGITALALTGFGFISLTTGIILQIVSRLQMTVEDIMYYEKRN